MCSDMGAHRGHAAFEEHSVSSEHSICQETIAEITLHDFLQLSRRNIITEEISSIIFNFFNNSMRKMWYFTFYSWEKLGTDSGVLPKSEAREVLLKLQAESESPEVHIKTDAGPHPQSI